MGTSQSAAQAATGLVGGPTLAASPGPPDAITPALAGMTRKQLYDIMAQMKGLIVQNPAQVTHDAHCNCSRRLPYRQEEFKIFLSVKH